PRHRPLHLKFLKNSYYEAVNGEVVDIQFAGNFEPVVVEWKVGDEVRFETSSLNLPLPASESAIYRVKALHPNGCYAKAEFTVEVAFGRDIYVPNVFSPNGDGNNDYFTIYGDIEIAEIRSFEIFSRWGDLVFSAQNIPAGVPSVGWDGRARSQRVPEGTYVYVAEVVLHDGTTQMLAGDVLLLY
ncbi:MAG: gliding motility-associated C-terminal domain-containing protein, partial [Bacteroidota bacterium]